MPRNEPQCALGNFVRSIRIGKGMSGAELAEAVGSTQATVSRIESGKVAASYPFVARLITALKLKRDEAAKLIALLEDEGKALRDLFSYFDFRSLDGVREGQKSALAEESQCKRIRLYQSSIVPGPLQTANYARNILLRFAPDTAAKLQEIVELRMKRNQQMLKGRTHWDFLIMESALRNRVADLATHIEQLEYLCSLVGARERVSILVIPALAELTVLPPQSFYLYDDHTVYTELGHGSAYISDREAVMRYSYVFKALEVGALSGSAAKKRIQVVLKDLTAAQARIAELL